MKEQDGEIKSPDEELSDNVPGFTAPKNISESLKVLNDYKDLIFEVKYTTFVPGIEDDLNFVAEPDLVEWHIE